MRLIFAAIAALTILGAAATTASSSTGNPLVLGAQNQANRTTFLTSNISDSLNEHGDPTLDVSSTGNASDVHQSAITATTSNTLSPAIRAVGNDALEADGDVRVDGALDVTGPLAVGPDVARRIVVEAGAQSATFPTVPDALVIGTVQQPRPNLWVTTAVPNPQAGTASVFLNRPVKHSVAVAVIVMRSS
jgi:hypothetical protein